MGRQDQNKEIFKEAENKLFNYERLCERIGRCKSEIAELEDMNIESLLGYSKSIVPAMSKTNKRHDITDAFEAQASRLKAKLEVDEYEAEVVCNALRKIRDDPYYAAVECKYFKHMTDATSCKVTGYSLSTLRRNRARLVKSIANEIYGE